MEGKGKQLNRCQAVDPNPDIQQSHYSTYLRRLLLSHVNADTGTPQGVVPVAVQLFSCPL